MNIFSFFIILNDVCYVYKHELIYLMSEFFDISVNVLMKLQN